MKEKSLLLIKNATLIDGQGNEPQGDTSILIEDRIIRQIKKGTIDVSMNSTVIDAKGKFVIPGLIDSHIHLYGMRTDDYLKERFLTADKLALLRASKDVWNLLSSGYTTVRDCGSSHALHIKRAIEEGTLLGPRIIASGFILSQTFGHGDDHFLPPEMVDYRDTKKGHTLICDGIAECQKAARFAFREGADFLKICTSGGILSERDTPDHVQFDIEEIQSIVNVAEQSGSFVASHAQNDRAILNAITAGVKTIEHGFGIKDSTIKIAKEKEIIFCPTLSLDRAIIDGGEKAGFPKWAVKKQLEYWEKEIEDTKRLYQAGVILAAATDFLGSPMSTMGENAKELELLMKYCSFDPMDAIVAATRNGAKACGLEEQLGTIEEDKIADMLILVKNPLQEILSLQQIENIQTVIKDGRICIHRSVA